LIWLSAVTRWIFDQGLAKKDFLKQWVNGVDEYRKSLEPFTMELPASGRGCRWRRWSR
jgi:formate dehydrogenase major subunit